MSSFAFVVDPNSLHRRGRRTSL